MRDPTSFAFFCIFISIGFGGMYGLTCSVSSTFFGILVEKETSLSICLAPFFIFWLLVGSGGLSGRLIDEIEKELS
jgi:hypothetical protein